MILTSNCFGGSLFLIEGKHFPLTVTGVPAFTEKRKMLYSYTDFTTTKSIQSPDIQ